MNRRGFLKNLTRLAIGIAAAPAIAEIARFVPAPVELAAAHKIKDFAALLNAYLPHDLLMAELMNRNCILQKLDRGDRWQGGSIPIPFSKNSNT